MRTTTKTICPLLLREQPPRVDRRASPRHARRPTRRSSARLASRPSSPRAGRRPGLAHPSARSRPPFWMAWLRPRWRSRRPGHRGGVRLRPLLAASRSGFCRPLQGDLAAAAERVLPPSATIWSNRACAHFVDTGGGKVDVSDQQLTSPVVDTNRLYRHAAERPSTVLLLGRLGERCSRTARHSHPRARNARASRAAALLVRVDELRRGPWPNGRRQRGTRPSTLEFCSW